MPGLPICHHIVTCTTLLQSPFTADLLPCSHSDHLRHSTACFLLPSVFQRF